MTALSQQMQGAMNQKLKTARIDTMISNAKGAMIDAANRIEKRPSLDGCNALEKTSNHSLIKANKDDSTFQFMQMAATGGSALEMAADVAMDTYANRKATQIRPQDSIELSPKHEAQIRQDNANDMKLFFSIADQLSNLEFLKENSGIDNKSDLHAVIDTNSDEIIGVKDMKFEQHGMTPKFNPNMTPEEVQKLEKKNTKNRIQFTQNEASKKHDPQLTPETLLELEHKSLQFPSAPTMGMRA